MELFPIRILIGNYGGTYVYNTSTSEYHKLLDIKVLVRSVLYSSKEIELCTDEHKYRFTNEFKLLNQTPDHDPISHRYNRVVNHPTYQIYRYNKHPFPHYMIIQGKCIELSLIGAEYQPTLDGFIMHNLHVEYECIVRDNTIYCKPLNHRRGNPYTTIIPYCGQYIIISGGITYRGRTSGLPTTPINCHLLPSTPQDMTDAMARMPGGLPAVISRLILDYLAITPEVCSHMYPPQHYCESLPPIEKYKIPFIIVD